jgi:hypothetical protein
MIIYHYFVYDTGYHAAIRITEYKINDFGAVWKPEDTLGFLLTACPSGVNNFFDK